MPPTIAPTAQPSRTPTDPPTSKPTEKPTPAPTPLCVKNGPTQLDKDPYVGDSGKVGGSSDDKVYRDIAVPRLQNEKGDMVLADEVTITFDIDLTETWTSDDKFLVTLDTVSIDIMDPTSTTGSVSGVRWTRTPRGSAGQYSFEVVVEKSFYEPDEKIKLVFSAETTGGGSTNPPPEKGGRVSNLLVEGDYPCISETPQPSMKPITPPPTGALHRA